MNRGLEALEKIKNKPIVSLPESPIKRAYDKNKEECDIIEAELKRLEDFDKWFLDDKDYKKYKTLEIIKELLDLKVVSIVNNDTRLIVRFGDVQYSLLVPNKYADLLKEVLL